MSFIYPRTIKVTRAITTSNINDHSYEGRTLSQEVVVVQNVKASIQQKSQTQKPMTGLPADVANDTYWRIFCKLPKGTVRNRDVITDELGIRYEVTASYWNSLSYNILAKQLIS